MHSSPAADLDGTRLERLDPQRVARAKSAYTTRRVPAGEMLTMLSGNVRPAAGDLVLAEITRLRRQTRLETVGGRRANLFRGDEVILCYGDRYAPDQFEAEVPDDLSRCQLAAAGGIAARVVSKASFSTSATEIRPLGLIADATGVRINLRDWALPIAPPARRTPVVIAVAGTSMNSGKTSTAAHLVRGLRTAGKSVGAAKVTGTGAGGDLWKLHDAGAEPVLDFVDMGLASTYRVEHDRVEAVFSGLVAHLAAAGVDVAVLEIADGLMQGETSTLLRSRVFGSTVDTLVFSAADPMGAQAGLALLRQWHLPVAAISGTLTRSPLARREARSATGLQVLDLQKLEEPSIAEGLIAETRRFEVVAAGGGE